MSPYAILGVSVNASDQEIKNAYRRLVKRYHPDLRSAEASHEQIAAINQAYDILSDPVKRANYDRGFSQIFVEVPEDPVEVYKREFKRKRRERERLELEQEAARKSAIYRVLHWIHKPIAVFGLILVLYDTFILHRFTFFHLMLFVNASYIGFYRTEYAEGRNRMGYFTIFLFLATLLSLS